MQDQWKKHGASRLVSATINSSKGLKSIWATEAAFRQEAVLCLPLVIAAFFLGRTPAEVAVLIIVCAIVLLAEILNSAIEAVVDRVGLEFHELSGKAKDLGSLAVMLSLILTAVVWGVVIIDRFIL